MKHLLYSKTLADARKELHEKQAPVPYKIVMGRRRNDDGTMELCYYAFDTKEDHEAWLANTHDEHQVNGPDVLRHANRNHPVKLWFEEKTKLEIIKMLQSLYGCSAETARWVHKNLASIYDKSVIKINE